MQPGSGSEFRVYLPVSEHAPPTRSRSSAGAEKMARGERILLLDDERQVGKACSRLLERTGYSVSLFWSPNEARSAFERDPSAYDLVITDMSMPEMDGLAFTRTIRAARPDIPVILATGHSASLDTQRELDIDALMNKPLRPDEFLATVRWVLDRRRST